MRNTWFVAFAAALSAVFAPRLAAHTPASLAGEYYEGDGLGVNRTLSLHKGSTFAFSWDGCLGRYDENEGTFTVQDGLLELQPRKPLDQGMAKPLPLRWIPVPWGRRLYLLEESGVPLFAQYVNQGWEPRSEVHGMFPLRREDWKRRVSGKPVLPERFRAFLLDRPVDGHVLRTLASGRAEIDVGARAGLQPGMLLTAVGPKSEWTNVTVVSVTDEQAVIEAGEAHDLTVGQVVSSRPK